jgi:hypothetical protein
MKVMSKAIEQFLKSLDLGIIRREQDIILVQLANLKLVEIEIMAENSYGIKECTLNRSGESWSEISIENVADFIQSLQVLSLDTIAKPWHIDDVLSLNPDLTRSQAQKVLQLALQEHDAELGINWDVLSECIHIVVSEESKVKI